MRVPSARLLRCLFPLLSVAAAAARAQTPDLKLAYTGGLLGYYRQDLSPVQPSDPTVTGLLLEALAAESTPTPPLIVGMGDNFAPEYGASLQWASNPPQGCTLHRKAGVPYPRLLYKDDTTVRDKAECDNVAAFLMQAGYRALVPGKEDFIYGSVWLRNLALQLRAESGKAEPGFSNSEHAMHLLAANLRIQLTPKDQNNKRFISNGHPVCPLLFSDPSTWADASGCQSGEAVPAEGKHMRDVGYTLTTLGGGGGKTTLLIGVVGTDLVDQVSAENKTFCALPGGSGASLTGFSPVDCPGGAGAFKGKVTVTDPLEAISMAIRAASDGAQTLEADSIVIMAQMKRGDAEELAAKLVGFAKLDPRYSRIAFILSGAYAQQASGNFTLSMEPGQNQIPVLTPHPAYDTGSLNFERWPMLQPLSTVTRTATPQAGYTLRSHTQAGPIQSLPATRSTWSLLVEELQKVPLKVPKDEASSCDAGSVYPPEGPPSATNRQADHQQRIDECAAEGMQYLLQLMRTARSADLAALERRDFFFGVLPAQYTDYHMCEPTVPLSSNDLARCKLNVALDRILWKGDYVESVTVKGSDLASILAASKTQSAQAGALAQPSTSGSWLATFGLVQSPEKKFNSTVQTSRAFAVPEDTNCTAPPPTPDGTKAKNYCINASPLQSDSSYTLVTSDHLATDSVTYTALSALPATYHTLWKEKGKPVYLTQALTDSFYPLPPAIPFRHAPAVTEVPVVPFRSTLPGSDASAAASTTSRAGSGQLAGNQTEIEVQQRLHFQFDIGKVFLGYANSSAIGGDQYIANNFQGVTDSRASAVSMRELDVEDQLRGLWSRGYLLDRKIKNDDGTTNADRYAQHLGFGFQTETEYDRSAQGNLNNQPANASYTANNFSIGPLFQYAFPLHNNTRYAGKLGVIPLSQVSFTFSPQFQRQLRGTFLYFPFSASSSTELTVPIDYSYAWNVREGIRLDAAAPKKWYQLSTGSYFEFGFEASEQHRVLSGLSLVNAPLKQLIACSASSNKTIAGCFSAATKAKNLTIDANTQTRNLTYASEPADGLYWDIQFKRQIIKSSNLMHELDLIASSKGDAFFRRGAASVLSTQTLYDVPLNVALTFQALPNLSFAPSVNFFYFSNQLAETQLLIRSFNVTARWYFDRDSHVPFTRQLLFQGPATQDQTRSTRMKQQP